MWRDVDEYGGLTCGKRLGALVNCSSGLTAILEAICSAASLPKQLSMISRRANEQQLLAGSLFAGSTRRLHRCELGTPRIRNARFSRCEWKALGLRPRMSRESRGLVALWQERRCNVVHKPPFLCKLLACTPAFVFENLAFMRSRKCRTVFQRHQILDLKPANLVE